MSRHLLTVCVIGQPAAQGSKRHVGGGRLIEQSAAVKPWREAVKYAARDLDSVVIGDNTAGLPLPDTFTGPLAVTVTFTVPKPKSAPKTRLTYPAKRPDLDKLLRSTLDALTDAGVWADDGLVVELSGRKTYPREHSDALTVPGALIRIREASGGFLLPEGTP